MMGGAIIAAVSIHGRDRRAAPVACALVPSIGTAAQPAPPSSAFDDLLANLSARIATAVSPADRVRVVVVGDEPVDGSRRRQLERELTKQLADRGLHP